MDDVDSSSIQGSTAVHHIGTKQSANNPMEARGIAGASQLFDMVSDSIDSGSLDSIDEIFSGGGAFSVWIQPFSDGEPWPDGSHNEGTIFAKSTFRQDNSETGWQARVFDRDGEYMRFQFAQRFGSVPVDFNYWQTERVIRQSEWTHVALMYNNESVEQVPVVLVNGEVVELELFYSAPLVHRATIPPNHCISAVFPQT